MTHIDFIGEADYYNRLGSSKISKTVLDSNLKINNCDVNINSSIFAFLSSCKIDKYLQEGQTGPPYDYSHLPPRIKVSSNDVGIFDTVRTISALRYSEIDNFKLVSSTPTMDFILEADIQENSVSWSNNNIDQLLGSRTITREVYDQGSLYWSAIGHQPYYMKSMSFGVDSACNSFFNFTIQLGVTEYDTPDKTNPWTTYDPTGLSGYDNTLDQDLIDAIELEDGFYDSIRYKLIPGISMIKNAEKFGRQDGVFNDNLFDSGPVNPFYNFHGGTTPERENIYFSQMNITSSDNGINFSLNPFKDQLLLALESKTNSLGNHFFEGYVEKAGPNGLGATPLPWIDITSRYYWSPVTDLQSFRDFYGSPFRFSNWSSNGGQHIGSSLQWRNTLTSSDGLESSPYPNFLTLSPEEFSDTEISNDANFRYVGAEPLIVQGLTLKLGRA